jgi:formylglycine-generating enzyme required for sulfatase activity
LGRRDTLIVAVLLLAACESERRPQLLVSIRSDLVLPAQLGEDPRLSASASIDRVRVEVLDAAGVARESNEFLLADRGLPLTFGVVPSQPEARARLRIVAYRSAWTAALGMGGGVPSPGAAIERLLSMPISGVQPISLTLRGDCVGRPSQIAGDTTCVDGVRTAVSAESAIDAELTEPGSWPPAVEVPCGRAPPADMTCVAGGVSAVGSPALASVDALSDLVATPPRTVMVSPFFIDTTEITVERMRGLMAAGKVPAPHPTASSVDPGCNYSAQRVSLAIDREAVRCISFETARAVCVALGGDLPSAAQWEHAARGRGLGIRYPWGDQPPSCCSAALAEPYGCAPARSTGLHANDKLCGGVVDRSRDGVQELAGGAREWVLDSPAGLDHCFGPGVLTDPVCVDAAVGAGSTKGGSFITTLEGATLALQRVAGDLHDVGFRCVRR